MSPDFYFTQLYSTLQCVVCEDEFDKVREIMMLAQWLCQQDCTAELQFDNTMTDLLISY